MAYGICPEGWSWTNAAIVTVIVLAADYITVLLSIRTPARLAASVSPIEAFRTSTGTLSGNRKETRHLHRHLTPMRLARMGFTRNKKAAIITILSLGVSGILFMTGFTILNSASAEDYSRQGPMKFGEVAVYLSSNAAEQNLEGYTGLQMNNPLDSKLEQRLLELDGVESIWKVNKLSMQYLYRNTTGEDNFQLLNRDQWSRIMEYAQTEAVSYDDAVAQNMIVTVDDGVAQEIYGWKFQAGDDIDLTWYNGKETETRTFRIGASISKSLYREEKNYDLAAEMGFFCHAGGLGQFPDA